MQRIHEVERVTLVDHCLAIKVDGQELRFPLAAISKKLANASELERSQYRVMASGYGIHWPLLDEDLSIDGLLGLQHAPPPHLIHAPV